jgi:hypothetical protein
MRKGTVNKAKQRLLREKFVIKLITGERHEKKSSNKEGTGLWNNTVVCWSEHSPEYNYRY